ncbi:hypothetical protein EXIGLDRAFT_732272 [Exidia glandulosa HHB12029]|uniref:Uncharacterized protein n=1 Tax=Exidia glandulosa HHB12029 TaxID=1314781 RepID=A0A165BKQ7_EXIGL|nr:hypothetical protein EXIGLDRAFT_732272 [Exidia glandulosa HHB12029]
MSTTSGATAFGPGEAPAPTTTSPTTFTDTAPYTPTTTADSSQQQGGDSRDPRSTYAASLYLFVFLATLLLLLALSVGVLVRSFLMRRRFRRRVEEAIAQGLLQRPGSGGVGGRNWTKPVLHEVKLETHDEKTALLGGWADIQPLNATILSSTATPSGAASITDAASSPSLTRLWGESRFPLSVERQQSVDDHEAEYESKAAAGQGGDARRMQLAVLVTMPGAGGSGEIALGVAREKVPDGWGRTMSPEL